MLSRLSSSEPVGFKESPGGMLHPFTSLEAQYLRNPSDPHPITIYILVPYAKTHPVTPAGDSWGHAPPPLFNKNPNISEIIQIPTPKPYIFFFLMLRHSRVVQSVGHLTRKSGVPGSIPGLATYFRFSFRFFKKGSCHLLAKVCARSTG